MLYERFIILAPNKKLRTRNILVQIFGGIVIWTLFPLALLIHLHISLYQTIYFTIFDIPKIRFGDFLAIDRWQLSKLNLRQKISCIYCGYGNAIAAWTKAVINQTEAYSCAIKHSTVRKGQEYQNDFLPYEQFR